MKPMEFLKELSTLINSISSLERAAGYKYDWCFERIDFNYNSPDENQLYYALNEIMDKLTDVKGTLMDLNAPIEYESYLHKNSFGKYEDNHGHYYSCGSPIEYLHIDKDTDYPPRWCFSRVEHDGDDYYIVGYRGHKLDKVLTRVRSGT